MIDLSVMCLLDRLQTALNKQNTDAPFVDMAQLKLWRKIVVVAPLFLPRFGLAAPAAKNESFIAASAASSLSGKNNGGVLLNVKCHCGCFQLSVKERYEPDYDFHSNDVHSIDWSGVHFADDADAQSPYDFHGTNRRQAVPPPSDGNDCSHFVDGRLVDH